MNDDSMLPEAPLTGRDLAFRRLRRREFAQKEKSRRDTADRVWESYCRKMSDEMRLQGKPPENDLEIRRQVQEETGLDSFPWINKVIDGKIKKLNAFVPDIGSKLLLTAVHELDRVISEAAEEIEAQIIHYEDLAELDQEQRVEVEVYDTAKGMTIKQIPIKQHIRQLHRELIDTRKQLMHTIGAVVPKQVTNLITNQEVKKEAPQMSKDELRATWELIKGAVPAEFTVEEPNEPSSDV